VKIMQLQQVNNKNMCALDFWLGNIISGLITKFAVHTAKSYTVAEKEFLKGLRGRYIRLLYTSINILLYDKVVMTMESKKLLRLFHHLSEKNRGACKLSWVC
jgi:hypothetical protein